MSILSPDIEPHLGIDLNNPWFKEMGFRTISHDPYGKIYIMRRAFTFHHELEIGINGNGNARIRYVDSTSGEVSIHSDAYEYADLELFQFAILKAIREYVSFEGPFYRNKTHRHKSKIRRFLERWLGFTFHPKGA